MTTFKITIGEDGATVEPLPPLPADRWRPAVVGITDVIPDVPCEIDTAWRWNGFACPRFTREVAEVVAEASATKGDYIAWRWEGEAMVLVRPADPYEPEAGDEEETYAPDADGRYHLGANCWTWEYDPDQDPATLTEHQQPS